MENKNLFSKLMLAILSINLCASTSVVCMQQGENTDCSICLENFKDDDLLIKLGGKQKDIKCHYCQMGWEGHCQCKKAAKCNHKFHPNCIAGWLKDNSSCPLCRVKASKELRRKIRWDDPEILIKIAIQTEKGELNTIEEEQDNALKEINELILKQKNGAKKIELQKKIADLKKRFDSKARALANIKNSARHSVKNMARNLIQKIEQNTIKRIKDKQRLMEQHVNNIGTIKRPVTPTVQPNNVQNQNPVDEEKEAERCATCGEILENPIKVDEKTSLKFHQACYESSITEEDKHFKNKNKPVEQPVVNNNNGFEPSNVVIAPKNPNIVNNTNNNNSTPCINHHNHWLRGIKRPNHLQSAINKIRSFNWGNLFKRVVAPAVVTGGVVIASFFALKKVVKKLLTKKPLIIRAKPVTRKRRWWMPCNLLGLNKKKAKKKMRIFG